MKLAGTTMAAWKLAEFSSVATKDTEMLGVIVASLTKEILRAEVEAKDGVSLRARLTPLQSEMRAYKLKEDMFPSIVWQAYSQGLNMNFLQ